jgi:undecaprenyl diphosphate synthase
MDEVRALDLRNVEHLGVTSGASTPERFFDEAVKFLRSIPRHVAIIMDGNGRWASARGKKRGEGHVAGANRLDEVLKWCGERGIRYLTVYAFSTENWKRPQEEVDGLMRLFARMLKSKAKDFMREKVRFRMIGRRGDLSPALLETVETLERKTQGFTREFIVAISYGGRAEIIDAVNRIKGPVTEETFRQYLYAPDVPDPDLVIRTSGDDLTVLADGRLLWRVIDNLLNNACKYALPGTRVYLNAEQQEDRVLISVKNVSRDPLNISAEELTERFVRGDASRNTEGSGLGLNIAQSLMQLQKGNLELTVDGDLFKVTLTFPTE